MSDEPFYVPNRPPAPLRQAETGDLLFEFVHGLDRYVCELRDHGAVGVEALFVLNGDLFTSRRFDTRALAVQWAEEERTAIENGASTRKAESSMKATTEKKKRR